MMKFGIKFSFGQIILAEVQYTDTFEIKTRPAVVLFEEYDNVVCTVITSNPNMKGISITKKRGNESREHNKIKLYLYNF